MLEKFVVVKYLRLSIDDGDKIESDSIENQRNLLDYNIQKLFPNNDVEFILNILYPLKALGTSFL